MRSKDVDDVQMLDGYQRACQRTAIYPKVTEDGERLVYCALALAGEAGEVANLVKKMIREHGFKDAFIPFRQLKEQRDALRAELGDVLWYCAMLAYEADFSLAEVARANIDKLANRYGTKS